MILDYMTLKVIWWCIVCVIIIAFAITGGMDIGVNFLLPLISKSEDERRLVLNSIGPTWEGNQVWLITLIAGLLAVWPPVYATALSSLYFAMMLVLLMLILRPPSIDYRSKINSNLWRKVWDYCLFGGAFTLASMFGIFIGNLFAGLQFSFDSSMRLVHNGSFIDLFSPATILFGLISLTMLATQGALFLQYKLQDGLAIRAHKFGQITGVVCCFAFILAGIYISYYAQGYLIKSQADINSGIAVTSKIVTTAKGAWLANYLNYPLLWLFPISTLFGIASALVLSAKRMPVRAIFVHSVAILCMVATASSAMFPFIIPSITNPNHSLTVWDASSSYKTLSLTLWAVIILLPCVLAYTVWVYRIMRGKVSLQPGSY